MEAHLLVTKEDFAGFADLPDSLDMKRLTPHILAVQRARLRPLLTEKLYAELARQHAAATLEAPYGGLLAGVVPVVCLAALARYMPFAQSTVTSNSLVQKTSQHSQPLEGRDLARMATIYDHEALGYEVELTRWLRANATGFAGFYQDATCGCGPGAPGRAPAVVVQGIRRTPRR